jgi:hypothetical protein
MYIVFPFSLSSFFWKCSQKWNEEERYSFLALDMGEGVLGEGPQYHSSYIVEMVRGMRESGATSR